MTRLLRIEFPGALYHPKVRENERGVIFIDHPDLGYFFRANERSISRELLIVSLYAPTVTLLS